jgi:hypothetical protein
MTTATKDETVVTDMFIIKRDNGYFVIYFKIEGENYLHNFFLNEAEVLDIINNDKFAPFYSDGYDLLQVTGRMLRFVNLEDYKRRLWIPFRDTELRIELKKALALETDVEMDLFEAYKNSLEQSKPNVYETIVDNALEITQLEGITPFLDHVRQIAQNSSKGQDDPVTLSFMKDYGAKDLYWVIARNNNRIMNGGIIYDDNRNTWGIHT